MLCFQNSQVVGVASKVGIFGVQERPQILVSVAGIISAGPLFEKVWLCAQVASDNIDSIGKRDAIRTA